MAKKSIHFLHEFGFENNFFTCGKCKIENHVGVVVGVAFKWLNVIAIHAYLAHGLIEKRLHAFDPFIGNPVEAGYFV